MKINLNILAKTVALKESGKQEVSIAQIKEIIKILGIEIAINPEIGIAMYRNGKKHLEKSKLK